MEWNDRNMYIDRPYPTIPLCNKYDEIDVGLRIDMSLDGKSNQPALTETALFPRLTGSLYRDIYINVQ